MAFELANFRDESLSDEYLTYLVDQLAGDNLSHYGRLWDYFRNLMSAAVGSGGAPSGAGGRSYVQAQEAGLPARITGIDRGAGGQTPTDLSRKEVVVENDIGWRVQTMVDFLFGKRPVIRSLAGDAVLAGAVERVVEALLEANGGQRFFQEMALLGAVYGFVDIALRTSETWHGRLAQVSQGHPAPDLREQAALGTHGQDGHATKPPAASALSQARLAAAVAAAGRIHLEMIEAPRVLPVLEPYDFRRTRAWVQRFFVHPARLAESRRTWRSLLTGRRGESQPASVEVVEVLTANWWQRYEDRILAAEGPNPLGRLPIVHVQNLALSGSYAGLSDVEPLIPLQDELNTRLSDRAQRVTYQSFKMYLGKGIDDFLERPVGPGQMWSTQNLAASIEEFGSDSGSPSEDAHIQQVRAALDKVSSVTPLAAGLVQGNVGYLTSATALKVLLGGLLARTARKRLTYGAGLQQVVELALEWLDRTGVLRTAAADRRIEVIWPGVIPTDESEMLRNAQVKAQLGLGREQVLAELGYGNDSH